MNICAGNNGNCHNCQTAYARSWAIGERHKTLETLLNGYKFSFEKESSKVLGSLMNQALPVLPDNVVVTYIPTIPSHIRERGYDHAKLIAKEFARIRGLPCRSILLRSTNAKQLGASKASRIAQAKRAYRVDPALDPVTYLIIDDIFTTGSTMKYGAKALMDAGSKDVYIAVIARQTLD